MQILPPIAFRAFRVLPSPHEIKNKRDSSLKCSNGALNKWDSNIVSDQLTSLVSAVECRLGEQEGVAGVGAIWSEIS